MRKSSLIGLPVFVFNTLGLAAGTTLGAVTLGGWGWLLGFGVSVVASGAVFVGGFTNDVRIVLKEKKKILKAVTPLDKNLELTSELESELNKLHEIAQIHIARKNQISETVNLILRDTQELFLRINERMDAQASRLAAINYTDILRKINKALGESYYLDIQQNPRWWDNPQWRLEQVERAMLAIENHITQNVQQVNASQDMDFTIAVDSLLSAVEERNAHQEILNTKNEQKEILP